MENKQKRIEWLDNAKGMAMLLVILTHTVFPDIIKVSFYSFFLPVFFILSGYTFSANRYKNFFSFIKRKIITLIYPAIALQVLSDGFSFLIEQLTNLNISVDYSFFEWGKNLVIGSALQLRGGHEYGAWFLICTFTAELLMYLIAKVLNQKNIMIVFVLVSAVGIVYSIFVHKILPWSLDVAIVAVSFMILGYALKENYVQIRMKWHFAVIAIIICVICEYINEIFGGRVNMYLNEYGNFLLFYISAILGSYFIVFISKNVNSRIINNFGRNTLCIYVLHYLVKDILEEIIPKFYDGEIIGNIFWKNTLNGTIVFFLTAVLILPIAVSVKKYLPWVLGRKKVKEN